VTPDPDAIGGRPLDRFAQMQGVDLRMDIWTIDHWTGEPSNGAPMGHDALAWLTDDELPGLRLAHPRLPQLLRAVFDAHPRVSPFWDEAVAARRPQGFLGDLRLGRWTPRYRVASPEVGRNPRDHGE